jgi:hypothetical protein
LPAAEKLAPNPNQGKEFALTDEDVKGLSEAENAAVKEAREKGRSANLARSSAGLNYNMKLIAKYCLGSTSARIQIFAKKITCL